MSAVKPARPTDKALIDFAHLLADAAERATMPNFRKVISVQDKGSAEDFDPVTVADRNAERAMTKLIAKTFPDHGIIGEEFGSRNETAPLRWVLDPVDGTRAFITNCFLFGTLIALERDDGSGYRPVLGVIAHPVPGVALIGHGDECTLHAADGSTRSTRVRSCDRLDQATVLATTHWSTGEQHNHEFTERIVRRARLYRTWGDCFGYFALATAGADLMLDPTLAHWDVAAIVPVIESAGGVVTSWSGGDPLAELSLIASAGALHDEVLQLLHPGQGA